MDDSFESSTDEITSVVRAEQWTEAGLAALMHYMSQVPDDLDAESDEAMASFQEAFAQEWHIVAPVTADADFAPLADIFEPFPAASPTPG